jgi:hypothetical protein
MFERTRSFLHRLTHPTTWTGEERRLWNRQATMKTVRVKLDDDDEVLEAQIQDISRGGARLQVDRDIAHGRMIRIDLPEHAPGMHTSVLACVVHVRRGPQGIYSLGCQFSTELSEQDMQILGAPKVRANRSDERLWQRIKVAGTAIYRDVRQNGDEKRAAIYNLSPTGVALLLDEEIGPGTLLQLDLYAQRATQALQILACVVYQTPHEDGLWLVGCNFIRELDDRDYATFLSQSDAPSTNV